MAKAGEALRPALGPSERPVPHPSPLTRPFWDACAAGRLTAQQCAECGQYIFTPQEFCRYCLSTSLRWRGCSGTGLIVTYTVIWRAQTPAFSVPYVVAVVELDEGYQMISNIVAQDDEAVATQVAVGDRVRVTFVPVTKDVTLPCFERTA